jgi:hypothetical protein
MRYRFLLITRQTRAQKDQILHLFVYKLSHTVATVKNSDKLDMTANFPFLGTGIGTSIKRGEIKLERFELK